MTSKLFETIISDIKEDPFFSEYKYKKSENMLYLRDAERTLSIEFEHWKDYDECTIYITYGCRFEILTKWFEKFSFKTLRDQRNNPNVIYDNTDFGRDEHIYFDYNFSDYEEKMHIMLPMIKENMALFVKKYSSLDNYYKEDVLPVITGDKELPSVGADWIFIYLTLGFLVDKGNYSRLKEIILKRVECMHSLGEPNVEHYYDKMDEILMYMENNVSIMQSVNQRDR